MHKSSNRKKCQSPISMVVEGGVAYDEDYIVVGVAGGGALVED